MFLISTAHAQEAASAASAASAAPGFQSPLFMMVLMLFVVYFLIIRPQSKHQKQLKKMISELKIGDEVVLANGIHGRVAGVADVTLQVQVADDVELTVERSSIQSKKAQAEPKKLK